MDQRIILATECVADYKFTIPMVIDPIEGTVNADYAAAPVRTAITDKDGKVVYYAGPGPFDFRIDKIERALKKVVAGNGYMPPPPPIQWGPMVNGLKYGMAIDPPQVKVGDDVVVMMKFENTTLNPINLVYQTNTAAQNIEIKDSTGQKLALQAGSAGGRSRMGGRTRRVRPQTIAPGTTYSVEIEGKIVAAAENQDVATGNFLAVANVEVTDEALAAMQVTANQPLWTGKLSSGVCVLDVGSASAETCSDCHSRSDYHHSDFQAENCENCHVGLVGTEDFIVKKDNCGQCHPRAADEDFGRRQILGPGGEFEMPSKHISGDISADSCVVCHDTSAHQKGAVKLKFDGKTEDVAANGASSAFCLSCHDGKPPTGVVFPAKAKGSGYDKSQSTMLGGHGAETISCGMCHSSHGSTLMSLLRDVHGR